MKPEKIAKLLGLDSNVRATPGSTEALTFEVVSTSRRNRIDLQSLTVEISLGVAIGIQPWTLLFLQFSGKFVYSPCLTASEVRKVVFPKHAGQVQPSQAAQKATLQWPSMVGKCKNRSLYAY